MQKAIIPAASDFSAAVTIPIDRVCWPKFSYAPESYALVFSEPGGVRFRMVSAEFPFAATRTVFDSDVHNDSCMELFLTPNTYSAEYLNFEFNPLGTMHVAIGTGRYDRRPAAKSPDPFRIKAKSSPNGWSIEFFLPISFLTSHFETVSKTEWRANLYKCGDKAPIEHYLCWSPITAERPDFHQSKFFGKLIFGGNNL